MKKVSILGSTGSVGRATVELVASAPEKFAVQAITCHRNVKLLAEQAITLKATLAVVADPACYAELKENLADTGIQAAAGPASVRDAAAYPADWIMAAIVGMAGLGPILAAVGQGTQVAIANKEPLVAAGPLVLAAARDSGAVLLPVDSEHNAIFQVLDRSQLKSVRRLILTASGGPFREWPRERMAGATPAEAVAHPNWSMGAKISVDSATMMNKALEIIEAHYLFDMPPEKIEVLLHPQSIVHSMVEYEDGSVLAQMGAPDMRTPIAHALAWPDRMATTGQQLDFTKPQNFDFRPLDRAQFPAVRLAYESLAAGNAACIAFNAANEIAVAAFLNNQCGFLQIVNSVSAILDEISMAPPQSLEEIISFDQSVRTAATRYILNNQRPDQYLRSFAG